MAEKLGTYTRYMNIILACPNGNIPDPKRNATRWGYSESMDYLLNFIRYVQAKFNYQGKISLFGYSLGGNQGIYTVSEYPQMFSHFVGISGGYSNLTKEQLQNIDKNLKILLISGDTGAGEIYTKNSLDKRYKELKQKELNVSRIVLKNQEHEINYKLAYNVMRWYAKNHSAYKSNFWIFRGNFYPHYQKAQLEFQEGDYLSAMQTLKKSMKLNPIFPPSHLLYLRSCLRSGNMTGLNRALFSTLQFYSNDPFYENKEIFSFFVEFRKTIFNDKSLKEFYIRFLSEKILEIEDILLPIYTAEIYYLLSRFALDIKREEDLKTFKEKAKYYYSQVNTSETTFTKAKVSQKLEWLEKNIP
ncbi:MAG: hypothetical protein N3A69_10685, partial [Leptospiraceae bacterium]|nr:hypothetical protein [Leptospiraceae bacterium]